MPELQNQLARALADRYVIEGQIAAGGMATVYLARDLKHERKVALKVLNPELGVVLGADRFLSEIRVTANLQHPNVLPLFDSGAADGLLYYVMPYVQGESLRQALSREKQLPVDDALHIATAVASALDYAHRHGVIHRDLKPENILLHEGEPVIADFGIALAVSNAGGSRITQTGISLGTPQYMSPEQATGDRAIDGRTDIYSLGAVLYEMLTGEPPHSGTTAQAVIAKVITDKPRTIRLSRDSVPEDVEWAVERALAKLPADRFATAHEFAEALESTGPRGRLSYGREAGRPASGVSRSIARWKSAARHPAALSLAAVALIAGALLTWGLRRESPDRATPVRFQLILPDSQGDFADMTPLAMSPDGRTLAYRTIVPGIGSRYYVRRANELASRAVPGTDGAGPHAAFSPDGRWLAFWTGKQLKKVEIASGTSVKIADAANVAGIAWNGDVLVVGGGVPGSLKTVPSSGGSLTPLTVVDSSKGEAGHYAPLVLADGETVLFSIYAVRALDRRVGAVSLRTGKRATLDLPNGGVLGVVDGLLIYHDLQGALVGIPFDAKHWRVTGSGISLVDNVSSATFGMPNASLSRSGSLAYIEDRARDRELMAVGIDGQERVITNFHRYVTDPRYSPDGRRVLLTIATDTVEQIWTYDIQSETLSPIPDAVGPAGMVSVHSEWSPDGKYVLYTSLRRGKWELWRQLANGSGPAERIQGAGKSGQPVQGMLTADGRYLIYRTGYQDPSDDLWYRAMSGDTTSKPLAADPRFTERNPAVSPDGQWVAYASTETGTEQIYVRSFPGSEVRYAVSANGGNGPVWSPDGRKLYYRAGNRMEEATIVTQPRFTVTRRVLFERPYLADEWNRTYDLSRDGTHFLMVKEAASRSAIVVDNWAAEVRARRKASPR